MHGHDRSCLVTVILANYSDAFIKTSKKKLLMELNRKLVDVDIGDRFGCDALDFQRNDCSKCVTHRPSEGQIYFVNFITIRDHEFLHGDGHLEGYSSFTFDFLLDWKTEHFDRKLIIRLFISKSERAGLLPRPGSVVKNF